MQRSALAAALALAAGAGTAAGAAGDPARGEQLYARCQACHAFSYDRVGPRHCGLLGRRAGSVPGFDYSVAMKKSGIVWTAKALDRFLAAPLELVPGTTMTYAGVADPKERADLIAYLKRAGAAAKCAPSQQAAFPPAHTSARSASSGLPGRRRDSLR